MFCEHFCLINYKDPHFSQLFLRWMRLQSVFFKVDQTTVFFCLFFYNIESRFLFMFIFWKFNLSNQHQHGIIHVEKLWSTGWSHPYCIQTCLKQSRYQGVGCRLQLHCVVAYILLDIHSSYKRFQETHMTW